MTPVRCASCRRTVAYSEGGAPLRNKVYCSQWCYDEPAATEREERNDQWRMLVAKGVSPVRVARVYDVAHSMVYKTVGR